MGGCALPAPPASSSGAAHGRTPEHLPLAVDVSSTYFGCPLKPQALPRRGLRWPLIASLIRYFDYPKAPSRVFAVLPAVKIVVLLREPVTRAVSAFNVRWLTWLCG
jgi:hypothetical protein